MSVMFPETKVTLIFLTINEIDGMRAIMPQIKKEWYDQLIIVDGNSTDGTVEYCNENGYYIFQQSKKGAGVAFLEAMAKATGDIVIIFSPDGNSVPERIPDLVEKMKEGYDIVICSRYKDGAKSEDDDMVTAFGNWMFTNMVNLMYGTKVTDCLVMYRAYKRDIVERLGINTSQVSWGSQVLCRAAKKKMRIGEIPGDEPARIGGVRKMHPIKNGISELCMIVGERFRRG